MNNLTPLATLIVAAIAVCIPPAAVYLLMDHNDDPRNGAPQKRGRADG